MSQKQCNKCKVTKPLSDFYKDKNHSSGHYSICKPCKHEGTYKWREKNRDRYNESAKKWRDNNPEKEYGHEIKRRYGITLVEYNELLKQQNNKCLLCNTSHDATKHKGRLYVDHCHTTGKIRGLLCGACNSMLGYAKDNIETLEKAIQYLRKHSP